MSYETYQPIYDAVSRSLRNTDVGAAIETAMRAANISFYADQAGEAIKQAAYQYERPSVVFRPKLYPDGSKWCALYGENPQVGVAGFGNTPELAMAAFDVAWFKEKTPAALQALEGELK